MSLYWSLFDFDDHSLECARVTPLEKGIFSEDHSKPCTCEKQPLIYQGSHVVPEATDRRGGRFGISALPRYILDTDDDGWLGFLRVHMNQETIVLTRDQVKELHENLTAWLTRSG